MKRLNLIGQRFGYLTVIEEAPSIINKSGKNILLGNVNATVEK